MKQPYTPNNLPQEIVYHIQGSFIQDLFYLGCSISLCTVISIISIIVVLHQITPDL